MSKMVEKGNDLILRIAQGDPLAFQEVYRVFHPKILRYSLKFTRSRACAEEIAQEVFIKVWETRERLNPELPFSAYLFRITRNHALNFLKRIACENNLKAQVGYQSLFTGNYTDHHVYYLDCQMVASKALDMLPPKRKMIFRMSKLEGVAHDQIATQLSISKHTIKSQIVKASKFIKKYFHYYYSEPFQPLIQETNHGC
jgi:RNA polymerase sigma-70 factor (family 1)